MPLTYQFSIEEAIQKGDTTQEKLDDIRSWNQESNLPQLPDHFLVLFLISCQNNLELTKKTMQSYFRCMKNDPDMFDNRDVDGEELKLGLSIAAVASIFTEEENVIHYFRLQDEETTNFSIVTILKLVFMLPYVSHQNKYPPKKVTVVLDGKGMGIRHYLKFKLGSLRRFIEYLQEGMPLRVVEIHILNSISFTEKIFFLCRPFMKKEVYEMVHLHPNNTNMEEFAKNHIPKKYLPKDYGGDLPSFVELNQKSIEQFRALKSFFEEEEALRKKYV